MHLFLLSSSVLPSRVDYRGWSLNRVDYIELSIEVTVLILLFWGVIVILSFFLKVIRGSLIFVGGVGSRKGRCLCGRVGRYRGSGLQKLCRQVAIGLSWGDLMGVTF